MIRINLLPTDRRRREKGPWPKFAATALAAAAIAVVAGLTVWSVSTAERLGREVADREKVLEKARSEAAETSRLDASLAPLRRRAEVVARVERVRRVTWARRLDTVSGILDHDSPRVWLTSIRGTNRGAGSPEATLELGCEAARDPQRPAAMGQITGEFVEALRRAFLGPGGDFTRYDDRYAEKATPRPATEEGWSNAFTVRLFRDRAGDSR